jgi:hypothetical protein
LNLQEAYKNKELKEMAEKKAKLKDKELEQVLAQEKAMNQEYPFHIKKDFEIVLEITILLLE